MKSKKQKKRSRSQDLAALRKESAIADRERIRYRLSLPLSERFNFLRVRLSNGGSVL